MFDAPGGAGRQLQTVFADLVAAEPEGLDVAGVEAAVVAVARVRAWLDAFELRCVARSEALAATGEGAGASGTLVASGRSTSRQAATTRDRARTVADAPELGDALAEGTIASAHIDAVARAAASLDDDARQVMLADSAELAAAAARMPADPFASWCRRRARAAGGDAALAKRLQQQKKHTRLRKGINADSGMYWINAEFDPETGERLFATIDAQATTMTKTLGVPYGPRTEALALAALVFRGARRGAASGPDADPSQSERSVPAVESGARAGNSGPDRAIADLDLDAVAAPPTVELVVLIDLETLTNGPHPHTVCETDHGTELSATDLARLGCGANITGLIRSNGVVLNAGRTIRVANRAQRRALRAMYPTCAFGGCTKPFHWCEIHHIIPWERDGLTDLDNLIPLCCEHHHLIHDQRWKLSLDPDRTLTITRPDGTIHSVTPGSVKRSDPDPGPGEPSGPRSSTAAPPPR